MLKFPIVDPTPLRLKKRGERLAEDRLTLGERVRQQAVEADQHKGKHQYLIGEDLIVIHLGCGPSLHILSSKALF